MLRIFRGDGGGKKTVIPEAALPPHFVIPEIVEDDYPGSPNCHAKQVPRKKDPG
jgi:hypothetical protein